MDAGFSAAVSAAKSASDDALVSVTLLSVSDGLEVALSRCTWDMESIAATTLLLGRMPEEAAPSRLVLGAFVGNQKWRDRYCDVATRLHELLPRRKAGEQRALALAWARVALLATHEQLSDKHTKMRVELPLTSLQQSMADLVKSSSRKVFDSSTRASLHSLLAKLADAHRLQREGLLRERSPLPASATAHEDPHASWVDACLLPDECDL